MNKIFTDEFYKALYDKILEAGKNAAEEHDEDMLDKQVIDFEVYGLDDIFITGTAEYDTEWHDGSFDHAFGTWHDPCPEYVVNNCIYICDIKVYEDDDCKKEIDGFDYDAFWAQQDTDSYGGYKKGAKVVCNGREAEYLAYNMPRNEYKVRFADGTIEYVPREGMKKAS